MDLTHNSTRIIRIRLVETLYNADNDLLKIKLNNTITSINLFSPCVRGLRLEQNI